MFSEESGWLHYHPFQRWGLPALIHCYNTNAFRQMGLHGLSTPGKP